MAQKILADQLKIVKKRLEDKKIALENKNKVNEQVMIKVTQENVESHDNDENN